MAHQQADTKTTILAVIEEYSHSDMALGPQILSRSSPRGSQDQETQRALLIMAHAHIHAALALMRSSGLSHQQIAEDFYIHADIQVAKGSGL